MGGASLAWYGAIPMTALSLRHERVRVATTMVWSDRDVAIARSTAELSRHGVGTPYDFVALPGITRRIPDEARGGGGRRTATTGQVVTPVGSGS